MISNAKKIVYVDMDDTLCDYSTAWHKYKQEHPTIDYPQSQPGFFTDLAPLPSAIESLQALIDSNQYDCYILTAPSYKNPHCYTEKRLWIEKHFGIEFCKNLIISRNKGLHKGDFLVDDCDHGKGQENFEGELIQFGSEDYPGWNSVSAHLLEPA